jgi:hypothetical protein
MIFSNDISVPLYVVDSYTSFLTSGQFMLFVSKATPWRVGTLISAGTASTRTSSATFVSASSSSGTDNDNAAPDGLCLCPLLPRKLHRQNRRRLIRMGQIWFLLSSSTWGISTDHGPSRGRLKLARSNPSASLCISGHSGRKARDTRCTARDSAVCTPTACTRAEEAGCRRAERSQGLALRP